MNESVVRAEDIRGAIRRLGLRGKPVCVHSSLRSFGRVDGGASTVVDTMLAEDCTVMAPSFTYSFELPPPPQDHPLRNGFDYLRDERMESDGPRIFTTDCLEISHEMGAIPAAVVGREGRARSIHPVDSFTAVGPLAEPLVADQTPLDVYAPFRRLVELQGHVLLMGVGLDSMTLLHYAEQSAGRHPFIRWARDTDGNVTRIRVGGCSDGFPRLDALLAPVERKATVGLSLWRCFLAAAVVERAAQAIREEPSITHCGWPDCSRCHDAVAGGPLE